MHRKSWKGNCRWNWDSLLPKHSEGGRCSTVKRLLTPVQKDKVTHRNWLIYRVFIVFTFPNIRTWRCLNAPPTFPITTPDFSECLQQPLDLWPRWSHRISNEVRKVLLSIYSDQESSTWKILQPRSGEQSASGNKDSASCCSASQRGGHIHMLKIHHFCSRISFLWFKEGSNAAFLRPTSETLRISLTSSQCKKSWQPFRIGLPYDRLLLFNFKEIGIANMAENTLWLGIFYIKFQ